MSKIFGHPAAAKAPAATTATAPPILPLVSAPPADTAEISGPPAPTPPSDPAPPPPVVDVTAVLDDLAANQKEKLDWRRSIVDLMKLVGIDSSLAARKELAKELDYPGDTGDSAKMNVWLHREVIKKLAANGGEVPAELLD